MAASGSRKSRSQSGSESQPRSAISGHQPSEQATRPPFRIETPAADHSWQRWIALAHRLTICDSRASPHSPSPESTAQASRRVLGPLLALYEHVWAEVEGRTRFRSKYERLPPSTDRWYPLAARRYRHTPRGALGGYGGSISLSEALWRCRRHQPGPALPLLGAPCESRRKRRTEAVHLRTHLETDARGCPGPVGVPCWTRRSGIVQGAVDDGSGPCNSQSGSVL